jgi:hypothetical protein
MKTEQTECSETSAYKIQTSGNYPEESIQISVYWNCTYTVLEHDCRMVRCIECEGCVLCGADCMFSAMS